MGWDLHGAGFAKKLIVCLLSVIYHYKVKVILIVLMIND